MQEAAYGPNEVDHQVCNSNELVAVRLMVFSYQRKDVVAIERLSISTLNNFLTEYFEEK